MPDKGPFGSLAGLRRPAISQPFVELRFGRAVVVREPHIPYRTPDTDPKRPILKTDRSSQLASIPIPRQFLDSAAEQACQPPFNLMPAAASMPRPWFLLDQC
jgi:hypothetical protein